MHATVMVDEGEPGPSHFSLEPWWQRATILTLIFAGNAGQALIYDALPPVLVPLAAHFGGGEKGAFIAQISTTLPLFGVGFGGLIAGSVIERFGLKSTLTLALTFFGVLGTLGLVMETPWLFVLTRLVMGLAVGLITPCSTAMIASNFVGPRRALMNGLLVSVGSALAILFIFISAWIATSISWRAPFLLHGVLAGIFLIPALVLRTRVQPLAAAVPQGGIRRLTPLMPLYALGFSLLALAFMFGAKLAFVLSDADLATPVTLARVFACNPIGAIAGSFLYARLNTRMGTAAALRLAFGLDAVGLILVTVTSSATGFGGLVMMNGMANGVGLSALWTAVMNRAPKDITPRALGLFNAATNFGSSLGSLIITPVAFVASGRTQYIVVAAATLLVLVATLRWGRNVRSAKVDLHR